MQARTLFAAVRKRVPRYVGFHPAMIDGTRSNVASMTRDLLGKDAGGPAPVPVPKASFWA